MKILITGARGMLGRTLHRRLGGKYELVETDLPELDLTQARDVDTFMSSVRPQVVIHGAAMTAVDRCETESDAALLANERASANVAASAKREGSRVIALSTDYVFRGELDRPYHEGDEPDPQTVYGKSKLAGERAVLACSPDHTILRVAWLYGPGGPSFVHTMLKLGAQDGAPLKVVNDQIGNPTSTDAVSGLIERLVQHPLPGVVHGTCEGEATWYEFAREIFKLKGFRRKIEPCTTAQFPRPAARPANSRLEKRAIRLAGLQPMPEWKETLAKFFLEFSEG